MKSEKPFMDEEFATRALEQTMDLFILPEITKRQENGEILKTFEIFKALVVFYPDGRPNQVRLNDEVQAIARVKMKPGISKKKGDSILNTEIEGIAASQLTEADDPDCGHILLVNLGESWLLSFDFRYNKDLSQKHIDRANEFIDCADFSFQKEYWGSFIDNLFSASELIAKSFLLMIPDPKIRQKTSHHIIKNGFNKLVNTGNLTLKYTETINKLTDLRGKGRYLNGIIGLTSDEAKELLDSLKTMRDDAERHISPT